MDLNILKPRKALNKAFLKVKTNRNEIELFKTNLIGLLDQIDETESEEFHKNLVSDFLKNTWYGATHFINTKGRNDLVIHNALNAGSTVGVVVEAKKPTNKAEMLRTNSINTKAFQELVLYYLRERITAKNLEIKFLVATNIYEWFIFDANLFEKEFAQNKNLVKQFTDFEEGRLSGKTTDFFYKQIAEPAIEAIKHEITFTHFDIRDYDKPLRNADKKDDNILIALYKLLSPEHLLKLPFVNDSNSLDKTFYSELLHIIGLTETKEGSKKLIQRKREGERNSASLIESAIFQLDNLDKISRLDKPSQFGATNAERLFNVALELSITWINRILFLKLLEAQLIKYHKGDQSFAFLNSEKVQNFDDLNNLFFSVLARQEADRNEEVKRQFANVPYLNSSLFEPTGIEHACLFISQLKDMKLPLLSSTVIKNNNGQKRTGELLTIEYIFGFLNAYDFASEGSEEIQEENKRLINASVLGLIFEKINGYKDGSFFTPGFITMYMCRETIRRAVVQKFNCLNQDLQNLQDSQNVRIPKNQENQRYRDLDDVYNAIGQDFTKEQANQIINSLKICDPAVGSGHFLVSALNEIIAIKSELKILRDREGKTLRDYHVTVENDELIVTDDDGGLFGYNPQSHESQRIQETLFHEKQTIIENCLFGVDINPNSVKICRLRLWIELLKNAYYKLDKQSGESFNQKNHSSDIGELETLPNIDINIKCGNSLISRYALDADIKKALKNSKWTIDSYRLAVMTYRNAQSKEEKRAMEKLIAQIKNDFESDVAANDKRVLKLNKAKGELFALTTQTTLFDRTKAEKAGWDKQVKSLTDTILSLETELEGIRSNKIYENAFEWRFEFPEVLNEEGDFVGFDVVIGNPPYIRQEEVKELSKNFEMNYCTFSGKSDIYVFFYERGINLLKYEGILNYITSGKFFEASYGKPLIDFLINESEIKLIINFNDLPVFEGVTAYPLIFLAAKNKKEEYIFPYFDLKELPELTLHDKLGRILPLNARKSTFIQNDYKFVDNTIANIISKSKQNSITIREFCGLPIVGVKTGYNEGFITKLDSNKYVKPYIFGRDIKKYQPVNSNNKIIFPYNDNFSVASMEDDTDILSFLTLQKQRLSERAIIKDGLINGSKCWFEYQQVNKSLNYNEEYIVYPNVSFGNNFTLSKGAVVDMTAFLIKSNNRYLLAILNSSLIAFLMNIWSISRRGGYLEYKVQYVEKIPIKNLSLNDQIPFNELVEKILKDKELGQDTTALESEIDRLVYQLYGLTDEEIKIVEGK